MTGEGRATSTFELAEGESLAIGSCGCAACGSRLVLATRVGLWFQGRLTARADSWTASNLSPDLDLWCVDLEDDAQAIRVPPGRAEMFIPFEFTGVEVRLDGLPIAPRLTVIGHEPVSVSVQTPCAEEPHVEQVLALRPGTAYMAVLQELTRGTRRPGGPPTSEEISDRLARQGLRLSRRAVDHHIEYLCQRLLPDSAPPEVHRGWRRVALATIARRARLVDVQEDHT